MVLTPDFSTASAAALDGGPDAANHPRCDQQGRHPVSPRPRATCCAGCSTFMPPRAGNPWSPRDGILSGRAQTRSSQSRSSTPDGQVGPQGLARKQAYHECCRRIWRVIGRHLYAPPGLRDRRHRARGWRGSGGRFTSARPSLDLADEIFLFKRPDPPSRDAPRLLCTHWQNHRGEPGSAMHMTHSVLD